MDWATEFGRGNYLMADIIYDWPDALGFSGQMFRVPGMAKDGGITAGGARVMSPEPGGFGRLDIRPQLAVGEYAAPWASWIASKTNGQIMKIRLAVTPQIATAKPDGSGQEITIAPRNFATSALAGSTLLFVDCEDIGQIIKPGHVIGHSIHTYLVDEVVYDGDDLAELTVTPPLRKDVSTADLVYFRPYFCGYISNGDDLDPVYDRAMNGNYEFPNLKFMEVIPNE